MNAKHFLILSAGLNVLLAAVLLRPTSSPTTDPAASDSVQARAVGESAPAQSKATARTSSVVTNTVVREISWQQVESPDYREYIANLRAIGCPEETIRDIINADVNKLYDEKKKLARGAPKKFEYWKAATRWPASWVIRRASKRCAPWKRRRMPCCARLASSPIR